MPPQSQLADSARRSSRCPMDDGRIDGLTLFTPELREAIGDLRIPPDTGILVAIPLRAAAEESEGDEPEERDEDEDEVEMEIPDDMEVDVSEFDVTGIILNVGEDQTSFEVPSLDSLFRGDVVPPVLGDYPEHYEDVFAIIEMHLTAYGDLFGTKTDQDLYEVFNKLRRYPDGDIYDLLHYHLWQVMALILSSQPLSRLEYEAILGRLERSARTFRTHSTSRNYMIMALGVVDDTEPGL